MGVRISHILPIIKVVDMQPTPVSAIPAKVVLDQQFAENSVAMMQAMGAQNVSPPLPRSAYLKNKNTGVILPWSAGLAEQRDIMVNCDANGNTDPAAWSHSVAPVGDKIAEREALHRAAEEAVLGYDKHTVPQAVPPELNAPVPLPHDAVFYDEYEPEKNQALLADMCAAL